MKRTLVVLLAVVLVTGGCGQRVEPSRTAGADPQRLVAAIGSRSIVLLGEVHDNAAQHAMREQALRRMTVDLARLQPGESVLDVGCGTGALTRLAKARVGETGRVCGVDAAPQMIAVACRKAARHNLAIDFQVGLIEQLAFSDNSFDVVLSSLMMHHLPGELKRQGLAEIARVLKPGGRLLVLDMQSRQSESNQGRIKRHVQKRGSHAFLAQLLHAGKGLEGMQDLPRLMTEAGFSQIEVGGTRYRSLGFVLGRTGA